MIGNHKHTPRENEPPSYYDDATISVAEVVELLRHQTVCPEDGALALMSELTGLSVDLLMEYMDEEEGPGDKDDVTVYDDEDEEEPYYNVRAPRRR